MLSRPVIRKTCRRYNLPHHAHFLTFSCFKRQPFLSRDRARGWMVDAIAMACETHRMDLWAWVIMPEHVHLLIFPRDREYSISRYLTTLKQSVAKRAIHFVKEEAPEFIPSMTDAQPSGRTCLRFWQRGGGYDQNLWSSDKVWEKIDYIHDNPVRRRLVERAGDWQWSSHCNFSGLRDGLLKLNWEHLPR